MSLIKKACADEKFKAEFDAAIKEAKEKGYKEGEAAGIKAMKAEAVKGEGKKVVKPDCFGKYPDKPEKKCRVCRFHKECKKK